MQQLLQQQGLKRRHKIIISGEYPEEINYSTLHIIRNTQRFKRYLNMSVAFVKRCVKLLLLQCIDAGSVRLHTKKLIAIFPR